MAGKKDTAVSSKTMSVAETAKYISVGRQIVYQLIDFRELLAYRENGAVRVDKAGVDYYRDSGKLSWVQELSFNTYLLIWRFVC